MFKSLHYPNFRYYFIGHTLSTLGTWVQQVALAWLVYDQTHSGSLLGLIAFLAMAPQLIVSPFAGAMIDKTNKRNALILVQILFIVQAIALSFMTYFHLFNSRILLSLSLLLGICTAIDTPLRQSFISDLVEDKANISNALALNAMIFNLSRFVGPPLAGILLTLTNPMTCFLANAISYLFLIGALIKMQKITISKVQGHIQSVLKEGYVFVFKNQEYSMMMLKVAVLNFTASSYVTILPILAKDYLHGGTKTLGYLWGMAGIGSVLSSLLLAQSKPKDLIQNRIMINMILCAVGLCLLGLFNLRLSYFAAMFLLGFGISTANVSTNIQIQQNTPASLRGRIVSIYTSIRYGFDALGGLCAGLCTSLISAKSTMLSAGCILLCFILVFSLKTKKQQNISSI